MDDEQTFEPSGEPPEGGSVNLRLAVIGRVTGMGAILFASAGTLRWTEAWLLLLMQGVWSLEMTRWLMRYDPDLLRERLHTSLFQEGQKPWDKPILIAFMVLCIPLLVVPGLDAVRYRWSHLPWYVEALGFALHLPGLALVSAAMRENTFLSRVVKIDVARGHRVISSGPYGLVRHPMYTGVILLLPAMPLALGSCYGLIPALLLAALLVVRTYLEDRTLRAELPGYEDYAQRTRYRLFPGVW